MPPNIYMLFILPQKSVVRIMQLMRHSDMKLQRRWVCWKYITNKIQWDGKSKARNGIVEFFIQITHVRAKNKCCNSSSEKSLIPYLYCINCYVINLPDLRLKLTICSSNWLISHLQNKNDKYITLKQSSLTQKCPSIPWGSDAAQDGFHTSSWTVNLFAFIIWHYNFNVFLTYCHFGWMNKINSAFHNAPLYTIYIIYFLFIEWLQTSI